MKSLLAVLLVFLLVGCSSTRKPAQSVLNQQEAHVLAVKLAATKFRGVISESAFENSQPPRLDSDGWAWHWRVAQGESDIEILVSFAPDGSSPSVDYLSLVSAVHVP